MNGLNPQELDEKEYLSLWLVMCEIRNRYCSLHDIVIKNLEKIKKPRSSNAENLYQFRNLISVSQSHSIIRVIRRYLTDLKTNSTVLCSPDPTVNTSRHSYSLKVTACLHGRVLRRVNLHKRFTCFIHTACTVYRFPLTQIYKRVLGLSKFTCFTVVRVSPKRSPYLLSLIVLGNMCTNRKRPQQFIPVNKAIGNNSYIIVIAVNELYSPVHVILKPSDWSVWIYFCSSCDF